ncbi:MAG: 2-oxo acid dehydrogenase subunit E2 [Thermoleophilaceae bacterium]|nr:2-oxo acid dehydrogenase subunit E2 [Thermoleophilaceae bacterium]
MATDITMPRLSDSMEEGTVLKWLVDEGTAVTRGEPLVEIETDKANMTYDADTDGVLVEIVAQEGDTLPIGEVIARVGEPGEVKGDGKPAAEEEAAAATERGAEKAEAEAPSAPDEDAAGARGEARGAAGAEAGGGETQAGDGTGTATRERKPAGDGDGRIKASPVARRMARELGVELADIEGTGPGGRIVKADVEAAAGDGAKAAPAEAPAEEREEALPAEPPVAEERPVAAEPAREEAGPKGRAEIHELTRLQQTIARRMAESKATAPDFAISLTVDMTNAVELRTRLKEVTDPAPSFNDMVVKAAAMALREHPRVNGAYRDGKFELYEKVNVGVAVAAEDALVVPTVFDADTKSLGQIARDARAAAAKVRDKTITPPELSGATFTVSNLGMFGIEFFMAIINPPQASILTVGKLEKRPAVGDNDRIVARDQMTLSLVCDHRILYGADGAQFLQRVKQLLEQPLSLAL